MSFINRISFQLWKDNLSEVLQNIETSGTNSKISSEKAFKTLLKKTEYMSKNHKNVFLVGNGASSSMASHIAADLCKNGNLATRCFTDASLLTALANDCGVEEMFAEPLRQQAHKNDMLVCISSSGESPNIINAVKQARATGMYIVTLSGMNSENTLRSLGDLNFYVPAKSYGFTETAHAAILHYWVDTIVEK